MAFDPAQFIIDYPQFANISTNILTNTFNYNVVPQSEWIYLYVTWDADTQYYWQCVILAHILTVIYGQNGNGISTSLSGRISQASTGDVAINFDYFTSKNSSEAEWNKSVYGQQVWKMMQALPVVDYVC